ncbi:MAG: hypothetical protein H8E14_01485 [Candidatus Marinimicrobia bacterium]|nr:hypothetical protein [Candidatus Neomarinimicrobiota bacterium]
MNHNDSLKRLAQIFYKVAIQEEVRLIDLCDEGIFFMPELAYAYECGKRIMEQSDHLFDGQIAKWHRELKLKNSGIADQVLELNTEPKHNIVVEFKLRAKINDYYADIDKLAKLNPKNYTRIFCVLLDMFTENIPDDGRIEKIENYKNYNLKALNTPFKQFSTNQHWYKSDVSCVVAAWQLVGCHRRKQKRAI